MRILLADDHALFRDGIASLLSAWDHEVVGQAPDGISAVAMARELQPDLVLLDVAMPGGGGLAAVQALTEVEPGIAIVMLTASEDLDDLFSALKAGARGYLLKNLESRELRAMLDAVARGEAAITPAIASRIIAELARGDRPAAEPTEQGGTRTASPSARSKSSAVSPMGSATRRSRRSSGYPRTRSSSTCATSSTSSMPRAAPRPRPVPSATGSCPTTDGPRPATRAMRDRPAPAVRPVGPTRSGRWPACPTGVVLAAVVAHARVTLGAGPRPQGGGPWAIASTSTSRAA